MIAVYKGYKGEVVNIKGNKLFYTLDPSAEGRLWKNYDLSLIKIGIPKEACCWWVIFGDDVTYYDGRRRMI